MLTSHFDSKWMWICHQINDDNILFSNKNAFRKLLVANVQNLVISMDRLLQWLRHFFLNTLAFTLRLASKVKVKNDRRCK